MSDAGGSGAGGPSAASVAALVEAIDARARQAGQESAATLLRGMLGSVSEVLTAIQDRLDHVEELLLGGSGGAGAGGDGALIGVVQEGLAAFNTRLGRLEEAFVQAVDDSGSGTQAVVDQVRDAVVGAMSASAAPVEVDLEPLAARMTAVEAAVRAPVDLRPVVERVEPLVDRLAVLEQLVRARADEPADPGAVVRASLAPVVDRLDALEAALRSSGEASVERSGRVEASVVAVPARLSALEERVAEVAASVAAGSAAALDPEALERLEAAVEHLRRDEASAQLVRLVEERLAAGMRAMTERADGVRRLVEEIGARVGSEPAGRFEALEAVVRSVAAPPVDVIARAVAEAVAGRFGTVGDRLAGLDARLDGVEARVAGVDENVAAVHLQLEPLASVQRGLRSTTDKLVEVGDQVDVIERLANDLGSLPAALATVQDRLGEVLSRPTPDERLGELGAKLDSLAARPTSDGELRSTVERLAAKLDALSARPTADEELRSGVERLAARVDELASRPAAGGDALEGIAATLDALTGKLHEVASRPTGGSSSEKITDAVRKEAELLTQRVAALAVGVEAARALLEQHVVDTEHSVGDKATDLGRRIAADFGIRPGRRGSGRGGRDPRELGPG